MSTQVLQLPRIDDVIARMEAVLDRCEVQNSRLGYFAALYYAVTLRVRDAIRAGEFEDCARMERLDVIFALRYLDALELHWAGKTPTKSWAVAFGCIDLPRPVVAQHLLLGINAHINLDLAIAAAQTAPGPAFAALRNDFERISDLLAQMTEQMQRRIARISPWFGILDLVGGRKDEWLIGYGIRESRALSWRAAQTLAAAPPERFELQVALHDEVVAALARPILHPGPLLRAALAIVRARERADACDVIRALRA